MVLENSIQVSNGFPVSTLVINVSGSLALGFFLVMADRKGLREWQKLGIGIGLIGAFTTFSNFSWNIIQLAQTSSVLTAMYVVGSILGGIVCAYLGELSANWILGSKTVSESAEVGKRYTYDVYD